MQYYNLYLLKRLLCPFCVFTMLFSYGSNSLWAQYSTLPQADNTSTSDAFYDHPAVLSNLGTISTENKAVCNLLTRHKAINQEAHILVSSDKPVLFLDRSQGNPTAWLWTAPGATPNKQNSAQALFSYTTPGVYDYPTLQVTTANGTSNYKPDLKLKVGGTSEITTMDMRVWGETYLLGTMPFEEGPDISGYMGGTNNKDIVGYGNLFMFGTDDAYMDGVNIYLHHKPTKFKEGAQIRMQVWLAQVTESDINFTFLPIEGALMNMSDIKADGEDGAWALTTDGAVASFTFDTPLDLNGKPIVFISVEGFSNDPTTEDFCLLMDLQGKYLNEAEASNRLSHNSFARLKGENDYLRPISNYGGGFGSFAICPIVRIGEPDDTHLNAVPKEDFFEAHLHGDRLKINSSDAGDVVIYNMASEIMAVQQIAQGEQQINVAWLSTGIYLIQGPSGKSIKIIKQ